MPTFFSRKYLRNKPGRTERVLGVVVLGLLGAMVGVFLLTGGLFQDFVNSQPILARAKAFIGIAETPLFTPLEQKPTGGAAFFAEIEGSGVVAPARIDRYAENLYEKIDGKEAIFRAFDVVDLKFGKYAETPGDQLYDVYVFDMADPVNAFGIYMTERSDSAQKLAVGRAGYSSGTSVYFWKGQYYVNILGPVDGGEPAFEISRKIAESIAGKIEDPGQPFWADSLLKTDERVPDSLRYQAVSALGYEFLSKVFLADYEADGKSYQMYLMKADSPESARDLFNLFAEATANYDKILSREASGGGETLVSESLGIFGSAFCRGVYFGGVAECEDQALAASRSAMLRDSLPGTITSQEGGESGS